MKRIALSVSLLFSIASFAQLKDTSSLEPVEVKTIRAAATAPFSKTNISKAEIRKYNLGQDIPFLLNQTPSVVINSDAGTGIGYTGIRIRGTDASRINVTLNGVPFNDPEEMGAFFVDLPDFLSSVNSIQVQRGVGTSSNGAASFGGTVNLSTNEINTHSYLESNNSYGSFSSLKNTVKVGTGLIADHFTTDLRLSKISSNGYIDRATSDLKSFYFSTAYVSDKSTVRFNAFSGKEKTYQAWYGVSEADLPVHRTINYAGMDRPGSPYPNQTDNYQQDHYQLFYTQKLSPAFTFNTGVFFIKGRGYYEEYKADQKYSKYNLPVRTIGGVTIDKTDLVRQLWLDNDFYGDIFSLQHQAAKHQVTLGGAVTKYIGGHYGQVTWAQNGLPSDDNRYYDNNAGKNDFNIYGKWMQDLTPAVQLFADLQYRRVEHNIRGFKDNPTLNIVHPYNFFNPKAGFTYHENNWLAFASYSIAHKEPNRSDFEASMNNQPSPERLNDLEIGTEKHYSNFTWGGTFYYMKYKDQLVLTGKINDVGAYTRTNIPDSYRMGVELQGSATATQWLKASANLTLSRNKVKNFNEYIDDYDNGGQKFNSYKETDISFSPSVTGAATITLLPLKHISLDLLSKYVGKQYLDNTSNESRKLNPYFTEDAMLTYSIERAPFKNINVIFQVINLFGKKYEPNGYTYSYYSNNELATENYYYPMAGTNWRVGLNIRL
ncbi:MAG: TonB-dependent receptor [Candidatus Dadabacteria bacterium]